MKKLILNIHLCVGLVAAVVLISLSVSGAIIAFENQLNRRLHPQLTNVAVEGQALTADELKARVEAEQPGWKLIRFYFSAAPDQSTYVRLRSQATQRIRHIYVNPYSGAVLGSTEDGSDVIINIHDLHVNFLSGKVGNQIVTWSTAGLLVLSITGMILWWPRRIFSFRAGAGAARVNRDLHRTVGFWSFAAMLMFSLTGLALHYQTGKLLNLLNTKGAAVHRAGHGTSIEGMMAAAREALPGTVIPRVLLSEKPGQPVFIYQRFPEDKTPAGRSFTTLDPATGAILSVGSTRTSSFLQNALVQWTREIHTGTIFGLASQFLVAGLALLLTVLAISGPFIYLNKWMAAAKGRRTLARRRAAETVGAD